MTTQHVQKQSVPAKTNHLKRLFVMLSTTPVEPRKESLINKPEKPAYLRYIEYV